MSGSLFFSASHFRYSKSSEVAALSVKPLFTEWITGDFGWVELVIPIKSTVATSVFM